MRYLKELIKIKTIDNEEEAIKYLSTIFADKCEDIKIINDVNNKKNIIIGLNTKLRDIEPLVLSGHIDTVDADMDKYLTNPYELVIKDNKAYGLGVIDMKCFVSSIIDLNEDIKNIGYPVVLALTTDEETTLKGVEAIIDRFKTDNIKPRFTIIGEPTSLKVNTISNGCFEYKVEVYGKSCHSSTPQNGINAICIMARLISFIEDLNRKYDDLVLNSNIVSGGTIINRIPDYAKMSFDIRTINMDNYNEAIGLISNKIKELSNEYKTSIDLTKCLEIPPLNCSKSKLVTEICNNLSIEIDSFSGGCEAGYYQNYSGDAILFGAGDLSVAHKPNEYLDIDDYYKYNDKLLSLLFEIKNKYYNE